MTAKNPRGPATEKSQKHLDAYEERQVGSTWNRKVEEDKGEETGEPCTHVKIKGNHLTLPLWATPEAKGPNLDGPQGPGLGLRAPGLRGSIWQMDKHRVIALALAWLLLVVWH